jgi:hypothetical protein
MKLAAYIGKEHKAERERLRTLIGNYIAASRDNLRGKEHPESMESNEWCSASEFSSADHIPNAILGALMREVEQTRKKGLLTDRLSHSTMSCALLLKCMAPPSASRTHRSRIRTAFSSKRSFSFIPLHFHLRC